MRATQPRGTKRALPRETFGRSYPVQVPPGKLESAGSRGPEADLPLR